MRIWQNINQRNSEGRNMKSRQLIINIALLLLGGLFSCTNLNGPSSGFTVTISGTIEHVGNNSPVDSVVVTLNNPLMTDTTKSDGTFSFKFTSTQNSTVNATLLLSHPPLFYDSTIAVSYSSTNAAFAFGVIRMKGIDSTVDNTYTSATSARPGFISLASSSVSNLSIRNAGGTDVTTLTFQVTDSLNVPVDLTHQAIVHFYFVTRPDSGTSGASLSRDTTKTNSSGQVTVQLASGLTAGIAQVEAYIDRVDTTNKSPLKTDTTVITSPIVSIPIYGGSADTSHFSMASQYYNIPGGIVLGYSDPIDVLLGDKYGNPAQPGTVVYFSTTGGVISPASGTSDEGGTVVTSLITGNPIPSGGFATITASIATTSQSSTAVPSIGLIKKLQPTGLGIPKITPPAAQIGKLLSNYISHTSAGGNEKITGVFSRSIQVLFSGKTQITSADSNFIVPIGTSDEVDFTVADPNGNPLVSGSTITVTVSGVSTTDVAVTGDVTKTLPDTFDKAFTKFSVFLTDKRTSPSLAPVPLTVSIEVTSPNGNSKLVLQGRLTGRLVSDSSKVGQIVLLNPNPEDITVTGGGGVTSKLVQFKVLDLFGNPAKNIPVIFAVTKTANGGEYVSPTYATSDSNGLVSTTVVSGIRSGTVQIVAEVIEDSLSLSSPPKIINIRTGAVASIALISVSQPVLAVQGVGGTESSTIIFEARDSLGNPIDFTNQTWVSFQLRGDTAGTRIAPNPARTDPVTGQVVASFSSGKTAGVVQVYASARNDSVSSSPVPITITGGFPVQSNFHFLTEGLKRNWSVVQGGSTPISVISGDVNGNPVKVGTSVSFTTNAGLVTGSSQTDQSGIANASLQIANPSANGITNVVAKTVGENGANISDTLSLVFSRGPVISLNGVPDTVTITDGGSSDINYSVADIAGNPISSGNTISASVSGPGSSSLALSGDNNVIMQDTEDKVAGTQFSFRIADDAPNAGPSGNFTITLTINGVSGTAIKTIPGVLLAPGQITGDTGTVLQPAEIQFTNITTSDLNVAGVGGTENSTITYQVLDFAGQPIGKTPRAFATYSLVFYPNTFTNSGTAPSLTVSSDSTDDQGKLQVSVRSGTEAGVVQVLVTINISARIVQADPVKISVHAGHADQAHFTIAAADYNFGGLEKLGATDAITVQVADKYSNPVDPGTPVYFNATNGAVQTGGNGGLTDANGFVTQNLYSSNPYPVGSGIASGLSAGQSWVYARTLGENGTQVIDSLQILWTGRPIITSLDTASFNIPDGGTAGPFSFSIEDYLGHPMAPGTTILVSGAGLTITGDANFTMPDVVTTGAERTIFTVYAADADPGSNPPTNTATAIYVTVTHPIYGTYTLKLASGIVN
jgi:hypothetical protein